MSASATVTSVKLSDQILAAHTALRERVLLKGSISYLQRKLGCSYNRAALLMAFMEDAEVIGFPNDLGDRRWLMDDRHAVERLRELI